MDESVQHSVTFMSEQLEAATNTIEILEESLVDLELAMEDRGWVGMAMTAADDFTREGRRKAAALCRILVIQNPLIKRGIAIRTGYIWGEGVEVTAPDIDVNSLLQLFFDDNKSSYSGSQAREESEKTLGTDGDIFRALPTSPLTGRVRVRTIAPSEIQQIHCNPEDRDEPWYYERHYTAKVAGARYAGLTKSRIEQRKILYPAMGFKPTAHVELIDGIPVDWHTPVQHIAVNRIDGWDFGIGDIYAAIFWARAYKEFLEDWSKLTKSLSRYAWRVTSKSTAAARGAAAETKRANDATLPRESSAGATAVSAGNTLEAIPKTGATIDSQSGKPLAGMVAAALGVPITMLLADPGVTGARATAETLDQPTKNEMKLRRSLWADKDRELYDYVIDQSIKASQGVLKGTVKRDEYGRERYVLAGNKNRAFDIDWPSLDEIDPKVLMDAIVAADDTGKVPPLTIARLILVALKVKNVDEVLAEFIDDDGNWIDPSVTAGQAAVDAFRRGDDPAEVLR